MVKILSQAGMSLADVYDIEGSIAGVEQLESRDVSLVHEMGSTIFSERLSSSFRRASVEVSQSTNFEAFIVDLPNIPTRILSIIVFSDNTARLSGAAVMLRDPRDPKELPIWIWDGSSGTIFARFRENGAALVSHQVMTPTLVQVPNFVGGAKQPQFPTEIAFRGTSTGFGAGTVKCTALVHIAFSQISGTISSHGLTIPSW